MDPILQVLLSWQFVLFGLAIATVIYVFRLVVEYLASALNKDLSTSKLWNNLILPIFPIIVGVVAAILMKKFPYPGFMPDAQGVIVRSDRIIFGLVTGLLSTLMYRVVKSLLYQKMVGVAQNWYGPYSGPSPNWYGPGPIVNVNMPTEQIPMNQLPSRGQLA